MCHRDLSLGCALSVASAQHVWTSGGLHHGLLPAGTGSHHWPDLHQPQKVSPNFSTRDRQSPGCNRPVIAPCLSNGPCPLPYHTWSLNLPGVHVCIWPRIGTSLGVTHEDSVSRFPPEPLTAFVQGLAPAFALWPLPGAGRGQHHVVPCWQEPTANLTPSPVPGSRHQVCPSQEKPGAWAASTQGKKTV